MLEGIRILDLTSHLSGPYCTWILGGLGAEVIKVERPGGGDGSRGSRPFVGGESVYFASINRNKKSLALDLKSAEGKAILEALVPSARVFIDNFRPGVRDRLDFSDGRLRALNPTIVPVSISGFGWTGPLSRRPAYDIIVQAMSGMMAMTGPAGGAPARVGVSIGDMAAGLFAAIGILAQLVGQAERPGSPGQFLDIAMLDSQMALLENAVARNFNSDEAVRAIGTRHPSSAPFQAFEVADGQIVVAAADAGAWDRFCALLGRPDLAADPRFAGNSERVTHVDALEAEIAPILKQADKATWLERLIAADIPAAPVTSVAEAVASEQVRERGLVEHHETVAGNPFDLIGLPFVGLDGTRSSPPPSVGQHSAEILAELGHDATAIAGLRERGVI